jgi:hypothetical protein
MQLDIAECPAGANVAGFGHIHQFAILHIPLPLNKTMASEGASPSRIAGSTLGGTGDQISVNSGWGSGLAAGACARTGSGTKINKKTSFFIWDLSPE